MPLVELFALIKQIYISKRGVTAVEYAVIASAVIIAIATLMRTIGLKLGTSFSTINGKLG